MNEAAEQHIATCGKFGRVLAQVDGRWDSPTPCSEWDVRGVVEHLIGFHDVLLLRPLSAKPPRPRDDPQERWSVTVDALRAVLVRPGLFDAVVEIPAIGNNPPMKMDARTLVPALTQDVVVHTWDVARAIGVDDRIDEQLCATLLAGLPSDGRLERSGLYASPVPVAAEGDPQSRLLGQLGRDRNWMNA
jgi:uncharacterized protein (TIGR03086 family)